MAVRSTGKRSRDSYLECVVAFPLKAIKSERHHDEAVRTIGSLSIRGDLDAGELEYVEALSKLIAEYEANRPRRVKQVTLDPVAVLRFLMKQSRMSISALGRIIGSQGIASEIVSGKRELSKTHIRKLAEHFHVDPGLFV